MPSGKTDRTYNVWVLYRGMRNGKESRMRLPYKARQAVCVAACLATALCAQAKPRQHEVSLAGKLRLDEAYFDGRTVNIKVTPLKRGERPRVVGPWYLGPRIEAKPSDKRPNLYIVVPGSLHEIEHGQEYDHNEILSAVPQDESDFDVWWVVVLDPAMQQQFHSEKELIVAAQQEFRPSADLTFDEIPGASLLRNILHVQDLAGLDKFRRPNGELPRIAIVNAHFSIRAHIEDNEKPSVDSQQAEK